MRIEPRQCLVEHVVKALGMHLSSNGPLRTHTAFILHLLAELVQGRRLALSLGQPCTVHVRLEHLLGRINGQGSTVANHAVLEGNGTPLGTDEPQPDLLEVGEPVRKQLGLR